MKIINLVLNNFTNDSRVLKTSRSLINFGHDVQVVAMHAQGLEREEVLDGLKVNRIFLYSRSWSKNKFIQLFKLIEFICKFCIHYRSAKVIHCNDLNALFVGVLCKITNTKIKLIYDSHEFAINRIPHQSKISIKCNYFLEKILIKYAVRVINVSESIAKEYSKIYGIDKPYLVLNCPPFKKQEKNNIFREKFGIPEGKKIFLYQGGLSKGRGIEILLEAFSTLQSKDCVIVFMGYGPLEFMIKQCAEKNEGIFFHSAVPPEILLNFTSSADYGILFYEDTCLNHRYCSPNKIFEYLMAGIPVITSNLFEMKRLVDVEGVGVVAETNTVSGFKDAVENVLKKSYKNLSDKVLLARVKYCWEVQQQTLEEVYRDI